MKINRAFIKGTNWALAGLITMLGFVGCKKIIETSVEYGTPYSDYTVKGSVVNKATGKPILGIRVGYSSAFEGAQKYGTMPTPYQPKASVITDEKGEFKLTESIFPYLNKTDYVYVDDIDGEENGLFQSDTLQVDFSNAEQTQKPNGWYEGEYTVNVKVELSEIKNQ